MVKTLVLVRHGDPEATSASGTDFDRELTPAGRKALECAYPRTFDLLSDDTRPVVWSSPALRALETAAVVADAVGATDIETHDYLYAQDVQMFVDELADTKNKTVIVVGHVPFVENVAGYLANIDIPFTKGAVMCLGLPKGLDAKATLKWYVTGPDIGAWGALSSLEGELASAAAYLKESFGAFLDRPENEAALREFRIALRRVRSLLQFIAPWQSRDQNSALEEFLRDLQRASNRLRGLDILSATVDDLVDSGELGKNSLLPMACARERSLERASLLVHVRKTRARKRMRDLVRELSHVSWRKKIRDKGVTAAAVQHHFDEELAKLDDDLFGLDLRDADAVFSARHDAKEIHYVAERFGVVLGPERAMMSEYMDAIQVELGALADARRNQRLAESCRKSPSFRGVRADLGVVARDQAEVVSAITSGLERLEADEPAEGPAATLDVDEENEAGFEAGTVETSTDAPEATDSTEDDLADVSNPAAAEE